MGYVLYNMYVDRRHFPVTSGAISGPGPYSISGPGPYTEYQSNLESTGGR